MKNPTPFDYSRYVAEQLFDLYATMMSRHQYVEMVIMTHKNMGDYHHPVSVDQVKHTLNVFKREIAKRVKPIKAITNLAFYHAIALKDHGGEKQVDVVFFFIGFNDHGIKEENPGVFSLFHLISREFLWADKAQTQKMMASLGMVCPSKHYLVGNECHNYGEPIMKAYIRKFACVHSRPVADKNTRRGDSQYHLFSRITHQFSIYEKEILVRYFFSDFNIGDNPFRTVKRTYKPRTEIKETFKDIALAVAVSRVLIYPVGE